LALGHRSRTSTSHSRWAAGPGQARRPA